MATRIKVVLILLISVLQISCSKELSGKGEQVAGAFGWSADKCLLDVRDNKIPYLISTYCNNLSGLHLAAISVDNPDNFSKKAREDYDGAFRSAWSAVALNNYNSAVGMIYGPTGERWQPTMRIW